MVFFAIGLAAILSEDMELEAMALDAIGLAGAMVFWAKAAGAATSEAAIAAAAKSLMVMM